MSTNADDSKVLAYLKAQLDFIEKGGYRIPDNALWRPPAMFLDSPTCLNYRACHATRLCGACILMQFVPQERSSATIPCHHIPLTEAGETVASAEGWADQQELEGLIKGWLRNAIAQLEETRADSTAERSAKAGP